MNFTDLDRASEPGSPQDRRRGGAAEVPPMVAADGADSNGFGDAMLEYEYMPTPLNPTKLERFRLENLALTFTVVLGIVFTIAALATPVAVYKDSEVMIKAYALQIHGCLYPADGDTTLIDGSASQCEDYSVLDVFCPGFRESTGGFVATGVLACLSGFVALIFCIFLTCGCAIGCRHLALVLSILQLICLFIATITSSTVLTNKRCKGSSLKKIGFIYGPSFPLVLTAFILGVLAVIFYIVRRCVKPVRYQTGSGFGKRSCCPCC